MSSSLLPQPLIQPNAVLSQLQSGQIFIVQGERGSGLIICHRHHAEIAGPGSAIGGVFDLDCQRVVPFGAPSLIYSDDRAVRRQAYTTRQRWLTITQKIVGLPVPLKRAQGILHTLGRCTNPETVDRLPNDVLAQLVGVLPETVAMARPLMNTGAAAPANADGQDTTSRSPLAPAKALI